MIYQQAALFHALSFLESKELEATWLQEDSCGGLSEAGVKVVWPCLLGELPADSPALSVSSLDEDSHLALCHALALDSWLPKPDQHEGPKARPLGPPGRAGKSPPSSSAPCGVAEDEPAPQLVLLPTRPLTGVSPKQSL